MSTRPTRVVVYPSDTSLSSLLAEELLISDYSKKNMNSSSSLLPED